jgi:glyoxylase-like metal-dependent hydrolase (beta-lactamase superfamily II)
MMDLRIVPINTGFIQVDKGGTLTQGRGYGEKIFIPATAWYIFGGKEKIMVDTGMCETERADRYHHGGSYQEKDQRIDRALKKIGMDPEEIGKVIFTHLHWDHCHNHRLFVNAKFYAHTDEVRFAFAPLPPYYRSYESTHLGIIPPFSETQFQITKGPEEIAEGITVFPTPGHSPGHQSVAVETRRGIYVITGDAVMSWENWGGDPMNQLPFIMNGRYIDLQSSWESFFKIKERAKFVLPGHEIKIFDKKEYP